ncbi:Transport protein particle subunit [Botrytis cinerea]
MGYNRKKAMVIRELVSVLIPALVQARLRGAAEMGVHPAAGLAALSANGNTNGAGALELGEGDMENGVDSFLSLLGQTYGVVACKATAEDAFDDSDEATILRILDDSSIRSFGSQALKMEVLRSCINLSEALPDFQGVLKFTADLLRTAGSGVAPGPRSEDASPNMSREEQIRLMTNITRTLGAARNLGVHELSAEYWDEFLVRGVELEPLPQSRTPIPHTRGELPDGENIATAREINPFIYNPFLRPLNASIVDHIMVAGEGAVFKVTLQNPYEFDVEIESFESAIQKTVIGPYRTQILTILGTPKGPGSLKITGCIIKVRGCRERRFPIFSDSWSPQGDVKIKSIGVAKIFGQKARPTSFGSTSSSGIPWGVIPPLPTTVGLNVIDKQPIVAIKSTDLSQSALMVLEGERQRFSITLENLSKETPVDLLLFSFKDSTQAPLQTAMSNREASPAELYEYELILARKQALRYIPNPDQKPYIEPGGRATFELEILGKPGLTSATVHVDYAHLGIPQSEVENGFHTRQVSLPLTITVNASIELARMDVMPFTGNLPLSLWSKIDGTVAADDFTPQDHCLLILDLRNAWPSSIHVSIDIEKGGKIEEEVVPGNTSRIMFPIPRIYLENPTASIPALDPSRQRQFVVSAGRISADSERATREAFWYREEILKILKGTWETRFGVRRKGNIELRGLRLSQRVIDVIRIEDISIDILINDEPGPKHDIYTDTFSSITVRISNRSSNPIHPLLRLQPSIRNHSLTQTLDLSKKFVWNGVLQQTLPQIPGNEHVELNIGMTPLCRGEFELSASVEEVRLVETPKEEVTVKEEPSLLVVRDEDDDSEDEEQGDAEDQDKNDDKVESAEDDQTNT